MKKERKNNKNQGLKEGFQNERFKKEAKKVQKKPKTKKEKKKRQRNRNYKSKKENFLHFRKIQKIAN